MKKFVLAVALSMIIAPLALAQGYEAKIGVMNGKLVTDTIVAMVVAESTTCEAKGYTTPSACSAFKTHRERIIADANVAIERYTDPEASRDLQATAKRHRDVERALSLLLAFGE